MQLNERDSKKLFDISTSANQLQHSRLSVSLSWKHLGIFIRSSLTKSKREIIEGEGAGGFVLTDGLWNPRSGPWTDRWFVDVRVCRPGVRLSDAEAPVHMRRQQQPPGARWEDTEHLVAAAGERPAGAVRGATCDTQRTHTHADSHACTHTQHGFINQAISIHDVPTYKKKIMPAFMKA